MCVPLNMSVCPASLCVHSCEDHESKGQSKVQGQVHEVPVHLGHDGQGEGRETEAVITARWEGRGGVDRQTDCVNLLFFVLMV